jgi:predicted DNA repair protein MutK
MAVKAKAKRKNKKNKKLNKKNKFIIALSVVLVLALAIGGSALAFRGREKVYYDFGKETARGYDVSEHNGKIDWQSLRNEVAKRLKFHTFLTCVIFLTMRTRICLQKISMIF